MRQSGVSCENSRSSLKPDPPIRRTMVATEYDAPPGRAPRKGMVWIPGGTFLMGSEDFYPEERPVHRVHVDGFWIDEHPVTVAQFRRFVRATNHVTFAELAPDADAYPGADPADLVPGSLVFTPPSGPVPLDDIRRWWAWTPGADWRHPEGPASTLDGRGDHPVVHVSWADAQAFCRWSRTRLPTEAEWEYAAPGGLQSAVFPWGDDLEPDGEHRMNVFQGRFPAENTAADGWVGTAPVDTFAPNAYGLYNMTGNVWEWCADPFGPGGTRVLRGGSHLCHASYCFRYRTSARIGSTPESSSGKSGFRCARPLAGTHTAPSSTDLLEPQ